MISHEQQQFMESSVSVRFLFLVLFSDSALASIVNCLRSIFSLHLHGNISAKENTPAPVPSMELEPSVSTN